MSETQTRARLYCDRDMEGPELLEVEGGRVVVFSSRCPGREGANEDAAAVVALGGGRALLAVADGMGGGPAGEHAAACAIEELTSSAAAPTGPESSLRGAVLDGLETANGKIAQRFQGAATTLAAAVIEGSTVRTYHVGDSGVLVVGQRGRLKHFTVAHSPTGYAVEAGLMDEDEALGHADRHVVSNVLGAPDMKIEIGPSLEVATRDTLLLATDGVFDNLRVEEVSRTIRTGSLERAAAALAAAVRGRMTGSGAGEPAKPDDFTFVLYRRI